jgi:hypothetical protein
MDAIIVTIGAVAFDSTTFEIKDTFYKKISIESCENIGLHKCENTIAFWKAQPKAVYDDTFSTIDRHDIKDVMNDFVVFWYKNNGIEFWCNGANFDEPILSTVFDRLSIPKPWKFWNVRCLRTLLAVNGKSMKMFGPVVHNALEDCKNQIKAYKSLFKR